MKRFIRKVVRILFHAVTGIAAALWVLSASSLDSESMMPTVVCALSTGWLAFAAMLANRYYMSKE